MPPLPPSTPCVVRVRRPLTLNLTLLALLLCAACALSFTRLTAGTGAAPSSPAEADTRSPLFGAYGKLPLSFEANRGQVSGDVRFVARGAGYSLFLTPTEAVFALRRGGARERGRPVLRMKLRGASDAPEVKGLEEMSGRLNYFEGADPEGWHRDVPLYSKVHYRGVYPGIDLVYYGNQGQLEYDFHLAPGADPRAIRMDFEGAERLTVEEGGDLLLTVAGGGDVRLRRPFVYQPAEGGGRREVEARYEVRGHAVAFEVGPYDSARPLVIDPVFAYSVYLGSTLNDTGAGIAVDAAGNAYVTGTVGALDFPNFGQNFIPPGQSTGTFVAKLDRTGSLVYSTIIGGGFATGIAVDAAGSAYVTGSTRHTDFPTVNPVRFKPTLTRTTDGGANWARSDAGLNVTSVVNLYISPAAPSTVFARTFSGIYRSTDGGANWSRLDTGTGNAGIFAVAVDPSSPSVVYIASGTIRKSTDGGDSFTTISSSVVSPTGLAVHPQDPSVLYAGTDFNLLKSTDGGANWTPSGGSTFGRAHSFVFDPTNAQIVYAPSDNLGGVYKTIDGGATWAKMNNGLPIGFNGSSITGLVIDPASPSTLYAATSLAGIFKTTDGGANWVRAGLTLAGTGFRSLAFAPTSPASLYAGSSDGDILKSTDGGANWTTVRDSIPPYAVTALAVRPDAPSTVLAGLNILNVPVSDEEAFVTKLSPQGNALVYSTFLGGGDNDFGRAIAVDSSGQAYVVGATGSRDFPVTGALSQPTAPFNAFVAKFSAAGDALVYSTLLGGGIASEASAVAVDSQGSAYVTGETGATDFPVTGGAFQTARGGGIVFTPDAFVTKINPAGTSLVYSTFLGGSGDDEGKGVAVDSSGHAYVAGATHSSDFPLSNPFQPAFRGGQSNVDAFVTKLSPQGNALVYSTFLGGSGDDRANAVALGPGGSALVVGSTRSDDFPVTFTLHRGKVGQVAGYVARLSPSGSALDYSTYLGGQTNVVGSSEPTVDLINGVAADAAGNVFLTGTTHSRDFPVTVGNNRGGTDAFVVRLAEGLTISGRVTAGGVPQAGFTVRLNGFSPVTTGPDGTYRYDDLRPDRRYEVSASRVGYAVSPPSVIFENLVTNQTADFTAVRREFVVTNTNDAGAGSLRQAIADSNALQGNTIISFNIPGAGVRTISPLSALPVVTGPVIIDATTQPGFAGSPIVELEGSQTTSSPDGLEVMGNNSVVRGLVVNRFGGNGLFVRGDGNVIEGNIVGLDPTGNIKRPNRSGVILNGNNNRLGGTTPAARNVISGNTGFGASLMGTNGRVQGNFIGTNAAGDAALGNGSTGLSIVGTFNSATFTDFVVGGTEPGARNVISGSAGSTGLRVGAHDARVQGNFIGTDASGTDAFPNGVGVEVRTKRALIGGTAPGAGNVISGNGVGIRFTSADSAVVQGNLIGTDASGVEPLPNTSAGIIAGEESQFGGDQPGAGNLIAFNGGGILIPQGTRNSIRGNRIFSNGGLGIDLSSLDGPSFVTPNDNGDGDAGPNQVQNFPLLTAVASTSIGTNVQGTLNSRPGLPFKIDFYSNATCDPSGHGEGASPFGSIDVMTNSAGNASFNVDLPAQLPAGRVLTATATDVEGNTSEFSPCDTSAAAGTVEFAQAEWRVIEDVGTVVIRVVRVGGVRGTLAVNYATDGGTATPGADYTHVSGTLTFAEGETEKTFQVPVTADATPSEPEETVRLKLSGAATQDQLGPKAHALLRIFDPANTPVVVTAEDVQIAEGDAGQKQVTLRFTLSHLTGRTLSVNYATQSGTAEAGEDFVQASGAITFAPLTTSQTLELSVIGDTLDEFDETFTLALTAPPGAQIARAPAVTIQDDDLLPALSVTDLTVAEGAAGARAVFAVRLSAHSARSVTVNFATADSTATAGSDYTAASGTLTFEPGQTLKFVEVPILADNVSEQTELFFLHLSAPVRATLDDSQGAAFILDASTASSTIQFNSNNFAAAEPGGRTPVTVTRTGDTSGAARISYRTVSQSASERTDFTAAAGTLFFGPGETSKSFDVLVNDDAYEEGVEWLDLLLFDPAGAALGGPGAASLSITSDDANDRPSPVGAAAFDTQFFIRQHYHDFFSREPDAPGLAFWTGVANGCGDPDLLVCRVNVSGAFFLSIEFQQTGYLVERTYKAAFGDATGTSTLGGTTHQLSVPIVRLEEFLPDTQRIGRGVVVNQGDWQGQLEANKQAYFLEFVQRQRFLVAFPATMTPAQFVDQLNTRAGNPLDASERQALIDELTANNTTAGRASVLRKVAEDATLEQAEKNRAFVLMQYFGYLRRNPNDLPDVDYTGYDFWLTNLERFNGNFVQAELVKAFISSTEYQRRFGR